MTGAPKISTMQIIEQVEKGDRNIYCGAIGLICPEETVFSVPIRICKKE
ncbi:MAG: chorismate-binding protein [Candidatus Gastranaerophilaceae bacterium]